MQPLRSPLGSLPATHTAQLPPPLDTCLLPMLAHSVQLMAPDGTDGWLPAPQLLHCWPSDEYVPIHTSQPVRFRLGCFPATQRAHGDPSELNQNVSVTDVHATQLVRPGLGCDPAAHRVHAAPLADTKPEPTTEQLVQPLLSPRGCLPGSQFVHVPPAVLYWLSPTATHVSQLLCSAFGCLPAAHFTQLLPSLYLPA